MNDNEIKDKIIRHQFWNYEIEGKGSREIEFLPSGQIGIGKDDLEQFWHVDKGRLFINGGKRATMALSPFKRGFKGKWAVYEQHKIKLFPVERFGLYQRQFKNNLRQFYDSHSLGTCVYQIHYLRKLTRLYPSMQFEFYINPLHMRELSKHIDTTQIVLKEIEDAPDNAINCWVNVGHFQETHQTPSDFLSIYIDFFKALSKEADIVCPINGIGDMLFDHPRIAKNNEFSESIDCLIVNSQCRGGDNLDEVFSVKTVELANRGLKVMTTRRISGIPCTLDYDLGLLDIAHLSLGAKYIIGTHSAPLWMCYNLWNHNANKKWIFVDNRFTLSYQNTINLNASQFSEYSCEDIILFPQVD